jgi:hypothetical protein
MERYSLMLRILITLLILMMMLPNWAPLNASHAYEKRTATSIDAIGNLASFDR